MPDKWIIFFKRMYFNANIRMPNQILRRNGQKAKGQIFGPTCTWKELEHACMTGTAGKELGKS